MWGNHNNATEQTRATAPTHADDWSFPEHNPCPDGWRVPSRWEWGDMLGGSANTDGVEFSGAAGQTLGTVNHWHWRNADPLNGSARGVGGRIVYSQVAGSQARIFLPAVDVRSRHTDDVRYPGVQGLFWSSTPNNTDSVWRLHVNSTVVSAGAYLNHRAWGFSVRCIK